LPYARVVSEWFDKQRGLVLGLTLAGVGVGTLVMPALAHWLVSIRGWRAAYACLGLLIIVIAVPTVALVLREKPAMMGLQTDGKMRVDTPLEMLRNRKQGAECRDAWHSRVFWVLAVAFFLVSVVTSGCLVHLGPC
jgi:sugar phosphate permease